MYSSFTGSLNVIYNFEIISKQNSHEMENKYEKSG